MFEDVYVALDSGTLEQLKELISKHILIEESINERNFITREMSRGLTSPCEQVLQVLLQVLLHDY